MAGWKSPLILDKGCFVLVKLTQILSTDMTVTMTINNLSLWSVVFLSYVSIVTAWGSEKILLTDVQTLTLYQGQMTTGRRSSPVPQLRCVGGTAGCQKFVPQVVQCTNKGTDGYDVQWECKTDMSKNYKFGRIQVSCEGYDHPNDPYILKGSCGLEYTIDVVSGSGGGYSSYTHGYSSHKGFKLGDVLLFVIICLVVYGIYRTCIANQTHWDNPGPQPSAPPPPGFRPEYTNDYGDDYQSGYGCNTNTYSTRGRGRGRDGGWGFWSGAGLGGLAGYFLGSQNRGYNGGYTYANPGYRSRSWWGGNDSWGTGGSTWSSGSDSSDRGTRTASGFGGTTRR